MSQKINKFARGNDMPKVPKHPSGPNPGDRHGNGHTPPVGMPLPPTPSNTKAPQFHNDDKGSHTDSEFLRAHRNSDLDHDGTSQHHSLGPGPQQAASGDHDHTMAGLPVGMLALWSGPDLPNNFFPCNGAAISRNDYPDYFKLVGTAYGVGDGSTTFNLPNVSAPYGLTYDYYIVKVKAK